MESPTSLIPRAVLRSAIGGYTLYPFGTHGLGHWARVLENGLRLSASTGADPRVVALFAVLHDCRRLNEGTDHGHGRRGASVVDGLEGELGIDPSDVAILRFACAHHTDGAVHPDPTIGTCWDADRLDLGRVGILPRREFMSTEPARDRSEIDASTERARHAFIPDFVESEWKEFLGPGGT